jgi:hypothetical protein
VKLGRFQTASDAVDLTGSRIVRLDLGTGHLGFDPPHLANALGGFGPQFSSLIVVQRF